ncbi:hypothetical protein RQP46_003228 [Phenoliferia psychrophenolica]
MGSPTINPKLESLRDRTVLIFGDSVDRDHNEDFCGFVAGDYEMIGGAHPLAPPYPKGEELPADGYRDYISGQQMWPDNPQSRPYICHVPSLNLRFINVFQWGFFDYDLNWIRNHPHFYPPLNPEDRFDQVVVPLLANIAKKYGTSAVPDIITISPSYWNMGMANDTAWMAPRIEQVIRKLASGWSDAAEKPMILWKSPHRMKTYDMDAITLVESFNQIGSPEVEDLSSRLRIDEWGQLMLGQEMHFKDHLHPLPLPGSFLWGNMMLDKLTMLGHRKIPSFSFTGSKSDAKGSPEGSPTTERSRSPSRGRSLSPWRRQHKRDDSAEGVRKDAGESDYESDAAPVVCPSNAFDSEDSEEWSEPDAEDELLEKNTELNASNKTPLDFLSSSPTMTFLGEGPNLLTTTSEFPVPAPAATPRTLVRRRSSKMEKTPALKLVSGRPIFEKNRCTVTLVHGDPELAAKERRTRKYLVASDLSEESLFAIQWAIGTVLRDGDECLIVSVIETDTKFDPEDPNPSSSEKKLKVANQRDRQAQALLLARQATALLERTRLNVTVRCQTIHAKNARHMLLDMVDYLEPTLVIVGTRGLKKVKGMLLGSVSNYLLQKSSAPVMVTRRPLRLARTVHKKLSMLNRESRVPLSEAQIEKESNAGAADDDDPEPQDVAEQIKKMEIHGDR